MDSPALLIESVRKRFADHVAVDDLSLAVPRGSVYGLLGPNGAGKTTTIRMAMGILGRDSGRIEVLGHDPQADRGVLRRLGYLPEERGLYKKMTVLDAVVFFAGLKGIKARDARARAGSWLERMGISSWTDRRIEQLSKGMQQKVQFVATVLHEPELLVLDEPFSGLDPVNQAVLRDTVASARAEGRTVVFSTHVMEHAEQICDSVCIVAGGRKLADGAVRELRRAAVGRRYAVEFDAATPGVEGAMRPGPLFARVRAAGGGFEVDLADGASSREVLAALNALDAPLTRFARVEPSLHEVFVARVAAARAQETAA